MTTDREHKPGCTALLGASCSCFTIPLAAPDRGGTPGWRERLAAFARVIAMRRLTTLAQVSTAAGYQARTAREEIAADLRAALAASSPQEEGGGRDESPVDGMVNDHWLDRVVAAVHVVENAPHPSECSDWQEDGCNCWLSVALPALYRLVGADPEYGRVEGDHPLRLARLAAPPAGVQVEADDASRDRAHRAAWDAVPDRDPARDFPDPPREAPFAWWEVVAAINVALSVAGPAGVQVDREALVEAIHRGLHSHEGSYCPGKSMCIERDRAETASAALAPLLGTPGGGHIHCDGDPEECSVEALRGEYAEVKRQRDALLADVAVMSGTRCCDEYPECTHMLARAGRTSVGTPGGAGGEGR